MPVAAELQSTVEAIARLAEEIARASPDCAAKALQIADLARSLDAAPDRAAIQDALDAEALTSDFSDVGTAKAASAVADALKR